MPIIPVTTNVIQTMANTPAQIVGAGDTLNLSANAGIFALGTGVAAHAISAAGANTLNLAGVVYSRDGDAINSGAGNHTIAIATTGSIFGFNMGIYLAVGSNTITNAGRITAGSDNALEIDGAGSNTVINTGAINSAQGEAAVIISGAGNSFNNSGLIRGDTEWGGYGIRMSGAIVNSGTIESDRPIAFFFDGPNSLNNRGTITGMNGVQGDAVSGSSAVETIINSGLIQNASRAITLFGGNDLYDGRTGQVIGYVSGDADNDTLLGGNFSETFYGGTGNDTLSGGGGADILDGGDNNDTYQLGAEATGIDTLADSGGIDTVTSTITRSLGTWAFIDNLILQGAANINGTGNGANNSIVGNGGNNLLAGQGGNDVLVGGGGNDQLFGQAEKDSLTGGAGNDRFGIQTVAHSAAGAGDVIVDLDDSGDDLIDLTGIIPGVLTFIGGAAFTAANQVRYQQVGVNVLVQINTAGASGAEGEITLLNTTIGNAAIGQVNAADFLL